MERWNIFGGYYAGEGLVVAEHAVCQERYQLTYGDVITAAELIDFIMAHECSEEESP